MSRLHFKLDGLIRLVLTASYYFVGGKNSTFLDEAFPNETLKKWSSVTSNALKHMFVILEL